MTRSVICATREAGISHVGTGRMDCVLMGIVSSVTTVAPQDMLNISIKEWIDKGQYMYLKEEIH